MPINNINPQDPIKVTKNGNYYTYEYSDGTIKCIFDEKNSISYNKKDNKNIQIKEDWSGMSVFGGNKLNIDLKKECTSIDLDQCKDSKINSQHNSINAIHLKDCTNFEIKADPNDIVKSNNTEIEHDYNTFKVNAKTYTKKTMLSDKDAEPQKRAKLYAETLFGGQKFNDIKIESGSISSDCPGTSGLSYKKASFPNGDVVMQTGETESTYLEYNKKNNPNVKIASSPGGNLEIKNANKMNIIDNGKYDSALLTDSSDCSYNSFNGEMNSFETVNCKNIKYNTDFRDKIKVDGKSVDSKTF